MKSLSSTALLDIAEAVRSRWFFVYSLVFGGLVVLLFVLGVTESRIMGFSGLSRLLVTYIQLSMAILPVFILVTTVRSVAGDREAGVFEYLLSLPVTLSAWYWGKIAGRFVVVLFPVFVAMAGAIAWGLWRELEVPWAQALYYSGFLLSLAWCFLGIGMLISTLARSSDVAQGAAFVVWLVLLLFLDLVLLGLLIKESVPPEFVAAIALANPLQVFRTATMLLFDPQLVMLGPTAFVILDNFGREGFLAWAMLYPLVLGSLAAAAGYGLFRRGDLP